MTPACIPRILTGSFMLLIIGALSLSCSGTKPDRAELVNHSFSRPDEVSVKNLVLDLVVDFDQKVLSGSATLDIDNKTGASQLYLDIHGLVVERVTYNTGEPAHFTLGAPVEGFGQPLIVEITPATTSVIVFYKTSPTAAALQWLEPAQTAGKKLPFLFTQSQAILARTWVPCQDQPAVRMAYSATIRVPAGMLALMSAANPQQKKPDGVYNFDMPQPIPSYLLALVAGDIDYRAISGRAGVYAEPPTIEKAAWEFADMEKMIRVAEGMYGPYRWGQFDVIVLPPSFPFGGMENPRLTFLTPTLLAGDRSLVSTLAHELAHSWSGNLVTNATWDDFWLNEGFTRYFERRIIETLYGREVSEMDALLGYHDLQETLNELGHTSADTRLYLDLKGRDPDAAVNDVAYEKGAFFLRLIEETVGRKRWDEFLHAYFDAHAFRTMTTSRFLEYLRENLIKGDQALEEKLRIDEWVYRPGLPDNAPKIVSDAFSKAEAQAEAFMVGTPARRLRTSGWTSPQWQHFLRQVPSPLTPKQMRDLDAAFNFTRSQNAQVLQAWLLHVIAARYEPAYPKLEEYLVTVGRRWLVRPLYKKLAETPDGLEHGRRIYTKARPGYHTITARTIDEILKGGG
jgi:leukotriene-A4 hydrolase